MRSPFFWQNLGVLLLVVANFALGVWLFFSRKVRDAVGRLPLPLPLLIRAPVVLYAFASCFVLLMALQLFYFFEVDARSRECWQRSARWAQVQKGMTGQQVVQILGEPYPRDRWGNDNVERYFYQLHPLGLSDGYVISLKDDPNGGEARVVDKSPTDAERLSRPEPLLPHDTWSYPYFSDSQTITDMSTITAFGGILVLALFAVIPFPLRAGWYSWTLYAPLVAFMLAIIYEIPQKGGWRFDWLLLFPAYVLILLGWVIRLIIVIVKSSRGQSVAGSV
jgi:hypothetical protein